MKWIVILLLISLTSVLLGACAPADQGGEAEKPTVTQEAGAVPTPRQGLEPVPTQPPAETEAGEAAPVQSGAYGEAASTLLQQALEDLAGRLGVAVDAIRVDAVVEVIWPDGSLGCPQPGQFYTQAIVPGYQILLSYQEKQYDYHADDRRVFLCEGALQMEGIKKANLAPELKLINQAIDDLAQRLGIARDQIVPEPLVAKRWSDTSLGCPEPGATYAPGDIAGYEIILTVKEQTQVYLYHSDLERVVYCGTK